MTQSIIPNVYTYAFVVPFYDFDGPCDRHPACDDDCEGFIVWKWNRRTQQWDLGGFYDSPNEAREDALAHHLKLRAQFEVADSVNEPVFEVPDWDDEEGKEEPLD